MQEAWFALMPHPLALLMQPAWASEVLLVPPMMFRVSNSDNSDSEKIVFLISYKFDINISTTVQNWWEKTKQRKITG